MEKDILMDGGVGRTVSSYAVDQSALASPAAAPPVKISLIGDPNSSLAAMRKYLQQ